MIKTIKLSILGIALMTSVLQANDNEQNSEQINWVKWTSLTERGLTFQDIMDGPFDYIELDDRDAKPEDFELLSTNRTLKGLSLGIELKLYDNKQRASHICQFIISNPSLSTFSMTYTDFIPDHFNDVCDAIKQNNGLIKLHFINTIADESFPKVLEMIDQKPTITELELSCHNIQGFENVEALCLSLGRKETLEKLKLHDNDLRDEHMPLIVDLISKNSCLTSLDLSMNILSPIATSHLFKVLKENMSVQSLNLSGASIACTLFADEQNKASLADCIDMIETNTTLKNLIFDFCGLSTADARQIAEAMKKNTSITSLSLKDNIIKSTQELFAESIERGVKIDCSF